MKTKIAKFLAAIGLLDALAVVTLFTINQAAASGGYSPIWQDLFPFPALYFAEVIGLAVVGIWAAWQPAADSARSAALAAGLMAAIVVLGVFSIGIPLLPALAALVTIAILVALQAKTLNWQALGLFLGGAVGQTVFMFLMIAIGF